MLPGHVTTKVVQNASDLVDEQSPALLEKVELAMDGYICAVAGVIASRLNLTEEQEAELEDRIEWSFVLR